MNLSKSQNIYYHTTKKSKSKSKSKKSQMEMEKVFKSKRLPQEIDEKIREKVKEDQIKIVDKILEEIVRLNTLINIQELRNRIIYNPDGTYYNFYDKEYSFVLEFTTYTEIPI